ncbi:hypothetical protein PTSG_11007 [Salpingoeca rosetta]|uniref:SKP1 component POZ domain-containing protein n=1 Tax=Salpingoeca rosetta (strain ATCC 50818 / BSB-021) TaxID=946362 RepID=F2USF4_SALR5|nr:uncharacterized protein PTSG_11007 [Salpingoeca rosetta]EGD81063.1 hypothetical protein PTSG_11007 [Salpingoeca rosetta]|eukprot:XP_004987932.1 hypothetical protein PTSG_11007 [Salpingoeca rosetta]
MMRRATIASSSSASSSASSARQARSVRGTQGAGDTGDGGSSVGGGNDSAGGMRSRRLFSIGAGIRARLSTISTPASARTRTQQQGNAATQQQQQQRGRHLTFQTKDDRRVRVPIRHAMMMPTIARMLTDLGADDPDIETEEDEEPIPLPATSSAAFDKVLAWCRLHESDEPVNATSRDDMPTIEADYLKALAPLQDGDKALFDKLSAPFLLELMTTASFLDMDAMFQTVTKVLSRRVAGKRPRQVPGALGIADSFTMEDKIACVRRFPFLLDGCEDIPELCQIKAMLEQEAMQAP